MPVTVDLCFLLLAAELCLSLQICDCPCRVVSVAASWYWQLQIDVWPQSGVFGWRQPSAYGLDILQDVVGIRQRLEHGGLI